MYEAMNASNTNKLYGGHNMAIEISNLVSELSAISSKKKMSIKDMARFTAISNAVNEAIKSVQDECTKALRGHAGETFEFEDLGTKVVVQPGTVTTEIDNSIFDVLTGAEVRQAAKITEAAIKKLNRDDAKELIAKYKIETGSKAPSVCVRALK